MLYKAHRGHLGAQGFQSLCLDFTSEIIPSTCTVNLQVAMFRAWSQTLQRITYCPSLNSEPDSGPFRKILGKNEKSLVYHTRIFNLGKKISHTYCIDMSAVSVAVGRSQDTVAVSFPGSATFTLDKGHFSLGGS